MAVSTLVMWQPNSLRSTASNRKLWPPIHHNTTAYIPQHNSIVECMNCMLLDKVCTMLTDASLPNSFWYNALEYAAILHNSLPTKPLPDVTPEEAWSSNKPNILWLCLFSCKAHIHVSEDQHSKLSMHSHICIFLSLMPIYKSFKLINHTTHKIYNLSTIQHTKFTTLAMLYLMKGEQYHINVLSLTNTTTTTMMQDVPQHPCLHV